MGSLLDGARTFGDAIPGGIPGQGSSAVGGGHRAGERTALKASGIFTFARLHAAGTD